MQDTLEPEQGVLSVLGIGKYKRLYAIVEVARKVSYTRTRYINIHKMEFLETTFLAHDVIGMRLGLIILV